jgi:hypothetical protein
VLAYTLKVRTAVSEAIDAASLPLLTRAGIIAAALRNDPREYIATHADPSRVKDKNRMNKKTFEMMREIQRREIP